MKIEKVLIVRSWGGFFNEDLAAIKSNCGQRDGFCYLGKPITPGFDTIRTPTEAASIVLVLDDGRTAVGDCLSVQYAGAGGRSPRFNHRTQLAALRELAELLEGRQLESFLAMCRWLEAHAFSPALNRTAAFYGASQALMYAVAAMRKLTGAQVIAQEMDLPLSAAPIPIYAQCGEDRRTGVDKAILHRADVLPHGLINSIEVLGGRGEKLAEYVRWIAGRVRQIAGSEYKPEIHIDAYGLIGQIFNHDAKRIAEYAAELARCADGFPFCLETPVLMESRAAQIEMFAAVRQQLEKLGSDVQLIVDEWANDIDDIRAFVEAQATHMINVKSPDLGSIHRAAEAVMACKAGGVRPILGGSCNDTDVSGRAMCHVALATQPAWILARPGMGLDEGFQIVHNEMARTLALIEARQAVTVA